MEYNSRQWKAGGKKCVLKQTVLLAGLKPLTKQLVCAILQAVNWCILMLIKCRQQ